MQKKKVKPYPCAFCDKKFKTTSGCEDHTKVKHHAKERRLLQGGGMLHQSSTSQQKSTLAAGIPVQGTSSSRFKCFQCNRSFTSEHEWQRHYGEMISQYSCSRCFQSFADHSALSTHMKDVHLIAYLSFHEELQQQYRICRAQFTCSACSISFNTLSLFEAHLRSSHSNHVNKSQPTASVSGLALSVATASVQAASSCVPQNQEFSGETFMTHPTPSLDLNSIDSPTCHQSPRSMSIETTPPDQKSYQRSSDTSSRLSSVSSPSMTPNMLSTATAIEYSMLENGSIIPELPSGQPSPGFAQPPSIASPSVSANSPENTITEIDPQARITSSSIDGHQPPSIEVIALDPHISLISDATASEPERTADIMKSPSWHCRSCLRDPCDNPAATMCGHIFCHRCIVKELTTNMQCPVCNNPILLSLQVESR
ncbi:uncharacterized protein LAESUDRAFT_724483 [Laetiporus sulphureus 93-53]|uniref:RING-type domain-containing protein n=1 Tax=Laetiporus sulphureus 93-53 TaxID=1314785 RepID=A0A165EYP4_9APHY|nr:uncharacterized protein LAESUDRAFT_724483 [Laetiporus sulphureus 93-53]KZT07997.1 hypothetical protein LAESUDRAFT_724483 [Laetiporus sulphureus 93-53]